MSERAHNGQAEIKPLWPQIKKMIGRFIYCHHCKSVTEMNAEGRDSWDRIVYRCPCGQEIRVAFRSWLTERKKRPGRSRVSLT